MSSTVEANIVRLSRLALREEPIGDTTLIQHLDRARVEAAGPGADEPVVGTLLDDRDVDLRQGQLRRQHHPRRAAAGDHHRINGGQAALMSTLVSHGSDILGPCRELISHACHRSSTRT